MNAAQMPGIGDEITWGPVMHPNDPRRPEPCDDDSTPDLIAEIRGLLDDAELQHELGQDAKARESLREICIRLQDTVEA